MKDTPETLEQTTIRKLVTEALDKGLDATFKQVEATRSFKMTKKYQMQFNAPAITAGPDNIILVKPGEIATFVALPGTGKTQICEALVCAYMADLHRLENIDTLGLNAFSTANKKCLYIDTERPYDDNYISYDRIVRRIGADNNDSLMTENSEVSGLDYYCFVELSEVQLLKDELERLCQETPYGLIVIDGALDFVASMNNEEECSAIVKWLRRMANKYGVGIAITLHPNKGSDTMAGHLGAMLYRWSRACLAIRPHESNSEIKVLASKFANGKLSHGGEISIAFTWNDDAHMMLTLPDYEAPVSAKVKVNRKNIEQIFLSFAISARFWVPSTEVKELYAERFGKSPKTAKDHLNYAVQNGWVERRGETTATEYKYIENDTNNNE